MCVLTLNFFSYEFFKHYWLLLKLNFQRRQKRKKVSLPQTCVVITSSGRQFSDSIFGLKNCYFVLLSTLSSTRLRTHITLNHLLSLKERNVFFDTDWSIFHCLVLYIHSNSFFFHDKKTMIHSTVNSILSQPSRQQQEQFSLCDKDRKLLLRHTAKSRDIQRLETLILPPPASFFLLQPRKAISPCER